MYYRIMFILIHQSYNTKQVLCYLTSRSNTPMPSCSVLVCLTTHRNAGLVALSTRSVSKIIEHCVQKRIHGPRFNDKQVIWPQGEAIRLKRIHVLPDAGTPKVEEVLRRDLIQASC